MRTDASIRYEKAQDPRTTAAYEAVFQEAVFHDAE